MKNDFLLLFGAIFNEILIGLKARQGEGDWLTKFLCQVCNNQWSQIRLMNTIVLLHGALIREIVVVVVHFRIFGRNYLCVYHFKSRLFCRQKIFITMSFSIIVKIRQKTIKCHNAFFACLHVSYSNSTDHWPVITQSRYSVPSIYALQDANNFGQQKWDFCWEKR